MRLSLSHKFCVHFFDHYQLRNIIATPFSDKFIIRNLLGLKDEKPATSSSICKAPKLSSSTFESEGTTNQSVYM